MVSRPSVKELFLSIDLNEKHVGWITKVMEYDVDIKIIKLIRGKGICEQMVDQSSHDPKHDDETTIFNGVANVVNEQPSSWLIEMVHFL